MTTHDFREGVLGVLPGVAREQFQVGVAHVCKPIGADLRNPPRKFDGEWKRLRVTTALHYMHGTNRARVRNALRDCKSIVSLSAGRGIHPRVSTFCHRALMLHQANETS